VSTIYSTCTCNKHTLLLLALDMLSGLTRVLYVLAEFGIRPSQIGSGHIHQITQTTNYTAIYAMKNRVRTRVPLLFCQTAAGSLGVRAGIQSQ
jgi:hypothetical protein